jgi:hypothetical protein
VVEEMPLPLDTVVIEKELPAVEVVEEEAEGVVE